ncbi:unnamed protein product, partial [Staurois parvus]
HTTAARSILIHGPVYGLQLKLLLLRHSAIGLLIVVSPTLLLGGLFNIGLCMAFNLSCLRFATLPWAPVPPPLAAARSRVCHGSLYGLPLLLTSSPDSAMCHFQVSLHCWWVPFC